MRDALDRQIIPRLVQSHRDDARLPTSATTNPFSTDEIEAFARLCAAADRAGAAARIAHWVGQGFDQGSVFVDLIGPAARYLGESWERDRIGFSDVTVGLIIMHTLVHDMGYSQHDGPQQQGALRRVMLASAPGSQHVLGLSMVSECFRNAGWQVVIEVAPTREGLCEAARQEWFDLIGLSVALDRQLDELAPLVGALKAASRNPSTPVSLGGPIFTVRPCHASDFGAQGLCLDARESVALAESLTAA